MQTQSHHVALIVVDVQNGFTPGGNLAVAKADQIIPIINQLAKKFEHIVLTQDWHPEQHISFADNHDNKVPFETIELPYGTQVLWPKHCVQGTHDAEFHPDLDVPTAQLIIRKGFHADIDSYSAFMEADRKTTTGLAAYLKAREIDKAKREAQKLIDSAKRKSSEFLLELEKLKKEQKRLIVNN